MYKTLVLIVAFIVLQLFSSNLFSQKATCREISVTMKTYPFSDPDPVPNPGRIYPYFRFDGYSSKGQMKEWKMVEMENDYIKVYITPAIGGKIWGAIEKSTGKAFLYYNHVVKFRDIAMRGPWTSGGLEYNFGDIGHSPTCATPVDYVTRKNPDGSVSCIVGALDLPSRTKWNIEIILPADKAYVETKVTWFNPTSLPCTYYHWMNAAAKASGNLQFIYPGDHYIGHGGESGPWPIENQRDLSFYEKNNFGSYKSYHVMNAYTDFYGGYWHDDDFGFGHWSRYDDKPGKKIWIWGLSDQGMIWKSLLTDTDDQYIEYQAGKLFNQAAFTSTFTPFKHKEFMAHDADMMDEIWFPLVKTGGMVAASKYAVLNAAKRGHRIKLTISALQNLNDTLRVFSNGKELVNERITMQPLDLKIANFDLETNAEFHVKLGNSKLNYTSSKKDLLVHRPIEPNPEFNWNSAFGLYTLGLEQEKQRMFDDAMTSYQQCLKEESTYAPALNRIAMGFYRKMDYHSAEEYALKSLSINTYDPEANYLYGLACHQLRQYSDAKSAFSIAAGRVGYRTAAYAELAGIFLVEKNYPQAIYYAQKALSFNKYNVTALEIMAIVTRKTNHKIDADLILDRLKQLDPTFHFTDFERFLWDPGTKDLFANNIRNEFPCQTYLELALVYYNLGCAPDAIRVLKIAPEHPLIFLWQAFLDKNNSDKYLQMALNASPKMVFPYRDETAFILEDFINKNNNWKLKYYLGLIYWNKGNLNKAKVLFNECGNNPDFAPFYLAKAKMFKSRSNVVLKCLQRARTLNNRDWRSAYALINFKLDQKKYPSALELAKNSLSAFPDHPKIGMSYAKSLLSTGKYRECVNFLEQFRILPFEGSTESRKIYHEACIREALSAFQQNKYNEATNFGKKAKKWPLNLGVGKPYNPDCRLENYLMAISLEKAGKKEDSEAYFEKLVSYRPPDKSHENSKLIFQLLTLRHKGQEKEAKNLLSSYCNQSPGNPYLKWVRAVYNNSRLQNSIRDNLLKEKKNAQPYVKTYLDEEFRLVTDCLSVINNKEIEQ